jgi:ribonuclease P protein component
MSLPTPSCNHVDNGEFGLGGLTPPHKPSIFKQLTSAFGQSLNFPACKAGQWRYSRDQENFSAEQSAPRQSARLPPADAYARWASYSWCPPSQGSHRTFRVSARYRTVGADPLLSKAHRVVSADDFKAIVRGGKRAAEPHVVAYIRLTSPHTVSRFGFIVTKNVGGSVVRNKIRRRLRALSADILARGQTGPADVVIRALPGSDELSWISLQAEVVSAIERGVRK